MAAIKITKEFVQENCDLCGKCFNQCPVLELPLDVAKAEIKSLKESGKSKKVLKKCTGCMACNTFCPNNANPHTLIMRTWKDRYDNEGIPSLGEIILPSWKRPNIFSLPQKKFSDKEKELINKWEETFKNPPTSPKNETMMFTSCNVMMQPFLFDSPIYDGIPIFGSLDICCGEPIYRGGLWDAAKAQAEFNQKEFERIGVKKIILPCLACKNLFTNVYPNVFDVNLNIEVVYILDWFLDRIKKGEIKVSQLNKKAVIHDNCWPKLDGGVTFNKIRDLLGLIGVEVIDPPHSHEEGLCCGMCAVAANFSIIDFLKVARKRVRELNKVKDVDIIVDYCGGCNWVFHIWKNLGIFNTRKVYHILELIQMASGEQISHKTGKRGRQVIFSLIPNLPKVIASLFPKLTKRVWVEEIQGNTVKKNEFRD